MRVPVSATASVAVTGRNNFNPPGPSLPVRLTGLLGLQAPLGLVLPWLQLRLRLPCQRLLGAEDSYRYPDTDVSRTILVGSRLDSRGHGISKTSRQIASGELARFGASCSLTTQDEPGL